MAGSASGALAGLIFQERSVGIHFAQHAAGITAGMFFAANGWQVGLVGYGLGQIVGVTSLLIVLAALRVARR